MNPAYLEKLSLGIHRFEIVSSDGKASTTFTILPAPTPTPTAGPTPSPTPAPGSDPTPKTGDDRQITFWATLLVISGCAFATVEVVDHKKRKQY